METGRNTIHKIVLLQTEDETKKKAIAIKRKQCKNKMPDCQNLCACNTKSKTDMGR
jgi:hypothetical protein